MNNENIHMMIARMGISTNDINLSRLAFPPFPRKRESRKSDQLSAKRFVDPRFLEDDENGELQLCSHQP
jgi:hypothetical protein